MVEPDHPEWIVIVQCGEKAHHHRSLHLWYSETPEEAAEAIRLNLTVRQHEDLEFIQVGKLEEYLTVKGSKEN